MKRIFAFTIIVAGLLSVSSCDQGFDELNVNKTAALAINPVFILNNAVINSSYSNGALFYEMSIVQQLVTPNDGVLLGANFNQDNRTKLAEILPNRNQKYARCH
jgi:hypothetical protein